MLNIPGIICIRVFPCRAHSVLRYVLAAIPYTRKEMKLKSVACICSPCRIKITASNQDILANFVLRDVRWPLKVGLLFSITLRCLYVNMWFSFLPVKRILGQTYKLIFRTKLHILYFKKFKSYKNNALDTFLILI